MGIGNANLFFGISPYVSWKSCLYMSLCPLSIFVLSSYCYYDSNKLVPQLCKSVQVCATWTSCLYTWTKKYLNIYKKQTQYVVTAAPMHPISAAALGCYANCPPIWILFGSVCIAAGCLVHTVNKRANGFKCFILFRCNKWFVYLV